VSAGADLSVDLECRGVPGAGAEILSHGGEVLEICDIVSAGCAGQPENPVEQLDGSLFLVKRGNLPAMIGQQPASFRIRPGGYRAAYGGFTCG
jgi:hypothetical protein